MTGSRRWGVQTEYTDGSGRTIPADPETVAAAVAELTAGGDEAATSGPIVVHPGDAGVRGEVITEDGRQMVLDGDSVIDLPLGYHRLNDGMQERALVCSPGRCHLPSGLHTGGWAVQLYAMRSAQSWGIGDLADLRSFGVWAAARGGGFMMINPLSAVAPTEPVETSPYLPTSRRFRNPLYLRVEEVPGATEIGGGLQALASSGRDLNRRTLIERDEVMHLKLDALNRIHDAAPPGADFQRWREAQGDPLHRFATFCALAEQHGADWRTWPAELHSPRSDAVGAARHRLAGRIGFFSWLQWLLEQQLTAAASSLPLMQDLPVGVAPGGADVWADQQLFATGFSVGAPPDLYNTQGQDWSQPPFNPARLRAASYAPFIDTIRATLHAATALRIDHVMGFFRLYWIPAGAGPAHGVFVRYPASDLLDILALESQRARAWVVGEDLGTVEPEVRAQMAGRDMLSYRLLWFEEGPPSALPRLAMSAVTTHDLPTIAGAWTGSDLAMQQAAGRQPNEAANAELRERLARVTGCPDDAPVGEVVARAYEALASSPSMVVSASLEDAAEVADRPNLPGTTGETHPNWSIPLPAPLDDVLRRPLVERVAAILRREEGTG